jgi:7-cyano-7-deazaguanine tRNA-ribosyltransferase
MRDAFELRATDGMARVGRLTVPRAGVTVETPALMPVINPNIQTISPRRLDDEFGAEILITNSYIIRKTDDLRERALAAGLHEMLDFPGAIVTDSGSFQLAEYGEIDTTTTEILQFQHDIGSDIGTPVDIPTPPDVSHERAAAELDRTEAALADAAAVDTGEMLVNAPVQGSTHLDLREEAGAHAAATELDVFPVGAVVPLLNAYRYGDMVEVAAAAKRGLHADCPVHLFGAGHPMMFAQAAAIGCDLFDSAAYALYARDGRYLTARGTEQLEDLAYLPCPCPVCTEHDPDSLRALDHRAQEEQLAAHNLHVTFAEIRRVRQAIREGSLLELVEQRARAHPASADGFRALLSQNEQLEQSDRISKGTFFYTSPESARRPEVLRHHERLPRLETPPRTLLSEFGPPDEHDYDAVWRVEPPFGPYPPALSETYPLNAATPEYLEPPAYVAAADGVRNLVTANSNTAFTLGHDDWPDEALEAVPASVTLENLSDLGA